MLRFGLSGLKTVVYLSNFLVLLCGIILLGFSISFRTIWHDADHNLGNVFTVSGDVTFFLALTISGIALLGFGAIYYCQTVAIAIYAAILGLLVPSLIICGFHLYLDSLSGQSRTYIRLESYIRTMSPNSLDLVQKTFHCCGVEKFTDYFLLWQLWNMKISDLKNEGRITIDPKTDPTEKTEKTPRWPKYGPESLDPLDLRFSNLGDLENLLGTYEKYPTKEKLLMGKLVKVNSRLTKVKKWIDFQLKKLKKKIKKWIQVDVNYLEQYAPSLTVHAVQSFLKTINNFYKKSKLSMESNLHPRYKKDDNYVWGLPFSCCRSKSAPRCIGDQSNTYRDGCRHFVATFYQRTVYFFAQLCLTMVPVLLVTMATIIVFKTGLLDNNYVPN